MAEKYLLAVSCAPSLVPLARTEFTHVANRMLALRARLRHDKHHVKGLTPGGAGSGEAVGDDLSLVRRAGEDSCRHARAGV